MTNSLYLLYRTGFGPTSGTSVYVSRLLRGRENSVVHLMWDISESGAKSVEQVVVADNQVSEVTMTLDLKMGGGERRP